MQLIGFSSKVRAAAIVFLHIALAGDVFSFNFLKKMFLLCYRYRFGRMCVCMLVFDYINTVQNRALKLWNTSNIPDCDFLKFL